MADNYTQSSTIIECGSIDNREKLIALLESESEDPEYSISCDYEPLEKTLLWIHDDGGYINIDAVVEIIHRWIVENNIDAEIEVCYANTCSKPRVGEFDGGQVFITKTQIIWSVSEYEEAKKRYRKAQQ